MEGGTTKEERKNRSDTMRGWVIGVVRSLVCAAKALKGWDAFSTRNGRHIEYVVEFFSLFVCLQCVSYTLEVYTNG